LVEEDWDGGEWARRSMADAKDDGRERYVMQAASDERTGRG
jgi:hypothetical protein